MTLQGDFYGVLTPNAHQIVIFMGLGLLVGYGIERLVDKLYREMRTDSQHLRTVATPVVMPLYRDTQSFVHEYRWHLAYTVLVTPLFLVGNGSATLYALAGTSLLGAGAIAIGLTGLTFVGIELTTQWVHQKIQRISERHYDEKPEPEPQDPQPEQPSLEAEFFPAFPSFIPSFR